MELTIQLAVIMIGKQAINNVVEVRVPRSSSCTAVLDEVCCTVSLFHSG
jgi:hypothetical protein